jgi:thymidylate kinase
MQIELIGCTGAGKSTLVKNILQACREQEIDVLNGDDFVLKQARLNWVNSYLTRTLLIDLLSLFACLLTWRNNLGFYLLTFRTVWRLPVTVIWFQKLNIVRNTLKKVGIYEIIRHRGSDQQVVLLDEGTLHTAHYLFVHVSVEPLSTDLPTFARFVPLPDVAIYLRQDERILIERTLARGHKRIPTGSRVQVERFIKGAVTTFNKLVRVPAIEHKLLMVDRGQNITTAPDYQNDPSLMIALKILRAGIDAINSDQVMGIIPDSSSRDLRLASNEPL